MTRVRCLCLLAAVAGVLATAGVRCFVMPVQADQALNILRGVSADDRNWYNILNLNVSVKRDGLSPAVLDMLAAVGADDDHVKARQVVRYLVTKRGSTGSQRLYGLHVLGTATACQFMNTFRLHAYFTKLFGERDNVDASTIRTCMSRIQVAVMGYVNRLAGLGQSVEHFVRMNGRMNEIFAEHDRDADTGKERFVECLAAVVRSTEERLQERCSLIDIESLPDIIKVNHYDENVFTSDHLEVDDEQLLSMIQELDKYKHVDFDSMDMNFWKERLGVKVYTVLPEELIQTDEQEESEDS